MTSDRLRSRTLPNPSPGMTPRVSEAIGYYRAMLERGRAREANLRDGALLDMLIKLMDRKERAQYYREVGTVLREAR